MMNNFGRIFENKETVKLDAKDKKILALLSENSRAPASEMARKVLLSRDAVSYRIKRLQQDNIILSFIPIINLQYFGYRTYHFYFLLNEKALERQDEMIKYIINHSNTKAFRGYTDTWDFEWVFIAKNIEEGDNFVTDLLTKFSDVVSDKEKLVVIKGYTSIDLPYYHYLISNIKPDFSWYTRTSKDIKCDKKDIQLLRLLSKDSRQSSYDLAKKLNISPDTVVYRIKRLVNANIIRKFSTLIGLTNLNYSWYTYVIRFKKFDAKDESKFREFVMKHPYVIRAVKLFGEWDVMLYIVADSPQNYHATVKEIKHNFSYIIEKYQTWLANTEYFFTPMPKVIR